MFPHRRRGQRGTAATSQEVAYYIATYIDSEDSVIGSRQEVRVIALHQAGGQLLLSACISFYSNSAEWCPPLQQLPRGKLNLQRRRGPEMGK